MRCPITGNTGPDARLDLDRRVVDSFLLIFLSPRTHDVPRERLDAMLVYHTYHEGP